MMTHCAPAVHLFSRSVSQAHAHTRRRRRERKRVLELQCEMMKRCITNSCDAVCQPLCRFAMNCIGFFTIGIAILLVVCVVYVYTHTVIPAIHAHNSVGYWIELLLFTYVSYGTFFSYFMSLWTHPGRPPAQNRQRLMEAVQGGVLRAGEVCQHCIGVKPPRTHHCSLCGHCVYKMDHHCPWINSCVGHFNQRYFIAFLIYLLVGTLQALVGVGYAMWINEPTFFLKDDTFVLFTFVISAAIYIAMLLFVGWNGYMVLTNQTAIESRINSALEERATAHGAVYYNPYNLGRDRNVLQVFGGSFSFMSRLPKVLAYVWVLAPSLQPLWLDGTGYPTVDGFVRGHDVSEFGAV